jgi:hypothetical protein
MEKEIEVENCHLKGEICQILQTIIDIPKVQLAAKSN